MFFTSSLIILHGGYFVIMRHAKNIRSRSDDSHDCFLDAGTSLNRLIGKLILELQMFLFVLVFLLSFFFPFCGRKIFIPFCGRKSTIDVTGQYIEYELVGVIFRCIKDL